MPGKYARKTAKIGLKGRGNGHWPQTATDMVGREGQARDLRSAGFAGGADQNHAKWRRFPGQSKQKSLAQQGPASDHYVY